jgi:hypothetical protein
MELALALDLLTVIACAAILLRYGRLGHSHPGTIYLIFHLLSFTWRAASIVNGSPPLFDGPFWGWGMRYDAVTEEELVRALHMADLALATMTLAFVKASHDDASRQRRRGTPLEEKPPTLRVNHIWEVVAVAMPLGLLGLYLMSRFPAADRSSIDVGGVWGSSSWVTITQTWTGISLLALIYWYGFQSWLILPMGAYLLFMSYQGYHRFRVVIPLIILAQIYLDRRRRRWPPWWMMGLLLGVGLLFFSLKTIGRMAQEGASISEIAHSTSEITSQTLEGDSELQFLDSLASTVTLVDQAGRFYYGTTYLTALALPVPRPLWPGKPAQNQYQHDISTPLRPMAENGMISTFLGEAYANFGLLGIVIVPFGLAYLLARLYFLAYRSGYLSLSRFVYLLIAAILIQVYRDGLISLLIHTMAAMMPLFLIVGLHHLLPHRKLRRARLRARIEMELEPRAPEKR